MRRITLPVFSLFILALATTGHAEPQPKDIVNVVVDSTTAKPTTLVAGGGKGYVLGTAPAGRYLVLTNVDFSPIQYASGSEGRVGGSVHQHSKEGDSLKLILNRTGSYASAVGLVFAPGTSAVAVVPEGYVSATGYYTDAAPAPAK